MALLAGLTTAGLAGALLSRRWLALSVLAGGALVHRVITGSSFAPEVLGGRSAYEREQAELARLLDEGKLRADRARVNSVLAAVGISNPGSDAQATSTLRGDLGNLRRMIEEVRVGMLTTVDAGVGLHSRPMVALNVPFDGTLWFLTREHSPKVTEVARDQSVSVTFADPEVGRFAAFSGTCEPVFDRARVRSLWRAGLEPWFPHGPEDPDLLLLRIRIDRGDYWEPGVGYRRLSLHGFEVGEPPPAPP